MEVARLVLQRRITRALRRSPVVALLGPRQCGKTTLARALAAGRRGELFDLEDPRSVRRLDQPMTALEPLRGLVVIDEVQLRPALLPVLRVLADRRPIPARFLLLGSATPELVRGASESLAGRVEFVDMGGFDLAEVGADRERQLWLRGGFPRSFLAANDAASFSWRESFIRTFLERDLRLFGVGIPAETLRRLWAMIAHSHGQIWNASEFGRSLGEAHTTIKRHLDILSGAMMVRQLPPWYANLGKRQVKSPKVYVRDSGLLHALWGVPSFRTLEEQPRLGASFEGFVVEDVARLVGDRNLYFWATQSGAELDLLVTIGGKRFGIEIKYADVPAVSKSMRVALADLELAHLFVVHPGRGMAVLDDHIDAVGLGDMPAAMARRGILARP
jgi:predicted AAA+ superfamily ATPase